MKGFLQFHRKISILSIDFAYFIECRRCLGSQINLENLSQKTQAYVQERAEGVALTKVVVMEMVRRAGAGMR